MGLDNLPKRSITLRRCEEDIFIKSLKKDEEVSESIEKFNVCSLFNLLQDGELGNLQPSLHNIVSLDLSECGLTELPRALKFLHLRDLNLSHNKLTMVPCCLYGNGLDTLESLDLSYNLITNFDIEPDCVLNLKILHLNNNCIVNIPSWFLTFRCLRLEELNYSENQAQHYNFLKHSCNFSISKLRKLELKNACLVDLDISWLKCFGNLQFLDISNKSLLSDRKYINRFKELNQLFSNPHWKEMKILRLSYLDISFFPEGIFSIKSLTELHISNNLLSWFPDGIEYLVNLEFLDISCNELILIPKQISQLSKLKVLIAHHNHLDEIPTMPCNLEVLDLYDNYIRNIEIKNFNDIMFIDLDYNFIYLIDLDFNYEEYSLKRNQFRVLHNVKNRCCECKLLEELYDNYSSSSGSSDSYYENSNYCDVTTISPLECQDEDWDRECEASKISKHPDITLSDEEYDGENRLTFNNSHNRQAGLYLNEEDWLFVDAD